MPDPFDTLGVEPRFDLDLEALAQRHRELSRALHPDRYASAPAAERRMALGRAIEVNDAFRVLSDPIRRAEALLLRAGVKTGEGAEPRPPPALLAEMMERREELEAARRGRDRAAIDRLAQVMRAREEATLDAVARGFAEANLDRAACEALLPGLGELRYLRRFLDEVSAIDDELALSPGG